MSTEKEEVKEVKDGVILPEDTSDKNLIPADAKFDQDGNEVVEEPTDKGTPSEDGKGGGDGEPPLKPSDTKKFKYKSQEEAETAYAEAERKMHDATTRASSLERELSQYKKPPEKPATDDDKITEITNDAIKAIRALPAKFDDKGNETRESIEERETKSAVIWGKANRKIARLEYDEATSTQTKEKEIANKLYKKATTDGLSSDDELDLVGLEYGRTDSSLSTDDRINTAVEAVKTRVSRLREGFIKRQPASKKDLDDLKVLGGGSHNRPTDSGKDKKDSKPDDMSSALDEVKKKRTVKKEDVLK